MQEPISFIDETIECLELSLTNIKNIWELFKKGKISKESFEQEYSNTLFAWEDMYHHKIYVPNKDYFKNLDI